MGSHAYVDSILKAFKGKINIARFFSFDPITISLLQQQKEKKTSREQQKA